MQPNGDKGATLLKLARAEIAEKLGHKVDCSIDSQPGWPNRVRALSRLTRYGELRGCIGTLEAHRPLGVDVRENAVAAAFRDPRFMPLTLAEFDDIRVEVSLLSPSEPLAVTSEAGCAGHVAARTSMAWCSSMGIIAAPSCRRCGSSCPNRPSSWRISSARRACRRISGQIRCGCRAIP